jgi:dienelactone hydrolase
MEKGINIGRTILVKCARPLLFVLLLLATTPSIVRAADELNIGSGSFVFIDSLGNKNKPITVFYYRPENLTANSAVVFVMHGANRNGREYRDTWIEYAELGQFLLLVPEFSRQQYWGSRQYNLGNTFTSLGEPIDQSKWGFTAIEHIFDYVKASTKIKTRTYSIYGHSAGGQFVHRLVLFNGKARINTAICANPGWYTMPAFSDRFPYGLKDSGITKERLKQAFQQKLIILLGDQDIDEHHISLRKTPEAVAQGKHRFERGLNFYKTAKHEATRRRIPLEWAFKIVRGVGHSNEKMAEAAAELLF